jgi:tetratricopeptide (TPR) repeat protein
MLDRLSSRLALLGSGPRDAPERHRSLRAAIDWSYELLTLEEQALLRRLSVFAGGATLDALERVCFAGRTDAYHVLDTLAALIDGSLVLTRGVAGESVRYDLLQTVREYGAEKLRDAAEITHIQMAHAYYFMELAETALPHLVSHDQRQWLDVLEQEHDNLRAALHWLLAGGHTGSGLRLAAALWRFWWLRGHIGEGQKWLDLALARGDDVTAHLRARVLEGAANLARVRGQVEYAASLADEDVRICRSANDSAGLAQALIGAGNVAFDRSDWAAAADLYREALGLKRSLAEKRGIAMALHNLAEVEYRLGSDTFGPLAEESLSIFQEVGDRWGMALARNDLARVAKRHGEYRAARALYEQSLGLLVELGDRWSLAECLEELAELFHAEGEPVRAASLLGISDALREHVGGPRTTSDQAKYDRLKNELRALLGVDAFTSAWSTLQGLPISALSKVLDMQQLGPRR